MSAGLTGAEEARAAQVADLRRWRDEVNAWPPSPQRAAEYDAISRQAWYAAKTTLAKAGCHSPPIIKALKLTILREIAGTMDDGERFLRWHERVARFARGIE